MAVAKTKVTLPSVKMPTVAKGTRNPKGWAATEVSIRGRGWFGAGALKRKEPAGNPPVEWTGTRPEWAIYWALGSIGLDPNSDFTYAARLPGVGTSYYSTVDFLMHDYDIGIEVQGSYWHMGQGSERIFHDELRAVLFASQGMKVIFIDEQDCLDDPIFFTKEALEGVDHSSVGR